MIILLMLLYVTGCDQFKEEYNLPEYKNPIKIGVVGDVSVTREQVENMFFGIKLAAEEINNKGGIRINNEDYEIQLLYENSAGLPEQGLLVTNKLINEGVNIIIGPTFSSVAVEMAELCISKNVLMVSYAATTPELSFLNDNNLIWRTCPSDYAFGHISAQYCYDSLQMRNAAILYRNDRFGIGLSEIIKNNFIEMGGGISGYISFPANESELESYNLDNGLNSIFNSSVDVVFIIAITSDMSILTNKIYNNPYYQSLEKKPKIFVNDGIVAEELKNNVNPEMLETFIGLTSTNTNRPNYIEYEKNYLKRFKFSPSTYSEHAYDAMYCIAYAMLRANSYFPEDIANYLQEVSGGDAQGSVAYQGIVINVNEYSIAKNLILKGDIINYEGASGPIDFDCYGDPTPVVTIWEIDNNEVVEIDNYN